MSERVKYNPDEPFPFGKPISFQESFDRWFAKHWDRPEDIPEFAYEMIRDSFFGGFTAMLQQTIDAPKQFGVQNMHLWMDQLEKLQYEVKEYAEQEMNKPPKA